MEDQVHDLLTFADGRQTLISHSKGVRVTIQHDQIDLVSTEELEVASKDIPGLRSKMKTHRLQFDKLSKKVRAVIRARPGG